MKNSNKKYGFTLMELMVAVIIIAVLAAVAVPQYKKAVLKSRFSTLMPVANSLAKGNEVYYLSQGEYSKEESKLDVEGQVSVPEGTEITLETDPEYLSYVRVANDSKVPNARYVVYQAHSKNFAGTTMCEAYDDTAKELCQSLGGVFVSENGTESNWTAYLLSGELGAGDSFILPPTCPENGVCDENFQLTGCESGYCRKDGGCVPCDFMENDTCDRRVHCEHQTFGDNAQCQRGYCYGATFSGESQCRFGNCNGDTDYGVTTFTENASCYNGLCYSSTFSDNASCTGAGALCFNSTFTDNASCTDEVNCQGSVFSGNAVCASIQDLGCSKNESVSSFKDNAVCAGNGCATANYEGNACCAGTSCPSGVKKCVYNSQTGTYERDGVWP